MDRVMEFYETARVDGLIKREETPKTMTEHYQGRPDFLSYRHVNFGPRMKKLALNSAESNPRPMVVSTCWTWGWGACLLWWAKVTLKGRSPDSRESSLLSDLSCFTKHTILGLSDAGHQPLGHRGIVFVCVYALLTKHLENM